MSNGKHEFPIKKTCPDHTTKVTTEKATTSADQTTEITTKSDTTTSTDHTTEITTTRNDKTTSADHTTKVTTEKATTSAEQTSTSLSTTRLAGSTSPQMSPTTKPNDKGRKLYLILLMVFAGGGFFGSVSIIVGLLIYYFHCRKFANDAVNGEDQPLLTVFDEQQGPLSPRELEKFAKDASLPHCNKIMNNKLYQNITTIQGRGKITIDTIFEENEHHLFCTVDMLRKWDKQQECSIAEKQRKLKRAVKDAKSTARTAYTNLDAKEIKALALMKIEDTAYDLLMMDIEPFAKELGMDTSELNTYDRRHQAIEDEHTGTARLLAMINTEEKFIVLREILRGSNDSSKCSTM
ncbi:uncharacterized protein LOC121419554 [Lytechinus variegatus]|uniref:uncharacterized protein LOC121419554 n=1 Tax=Lytechinus variegatus TaxID=7654 RepID=UPI001BB208F3|nr:uncharacterized protein LOC121419554 [Lytechinus variegatus]